MKTVFPFVGGAYKLSSIPLDTQNCVNWYLTYDSKGKFPTALLPFPGLKLWSTGIAGEINVRTMFERNGHLYVVINDKLILFNTNGEREKTLGTLDSSTGRIKIISNDFQLFITNGLSGYIYQIFDNGERKKDDFFKMEIANFTISTPVFSGSGTLDDLLAGGTYTGTVPISYQVIIDSTDIAGRGFDTFKWSSDNGSTFTENIAITATAQKLDNGIEVTFTNKTGHDKNDKWTFNVDVDGDFNVPLIPDSQDGYGIFPRQNSRRFDLTSIDDFSDVSATQFARVQVENLVASISLRRELWLFQERTASIWYNIGGDSFPFEERQNLNIKYGLLAPYSLHADSDNALFWLSESQTGDRVIVMGEGYKPIIISNEGVNNALKSYSKVDDAFAFCYEWNGHKFYNIIFPTADKTWVYDKITKEWFERKSVLSNIQPSTSEKREGRWRANCYAYFAGKHLIGDFENGNIYEMDDDKFTENSELMICERTTQHVQDNLTRTFFNSLQVDIQAATGLVTGQGEIPACMLQISREGGQQFGNELWRTCGKIGNLTARARWNRLGQARVWTMRLRISDPIYRVVLGAIVDIQRTGE